MSENLYFVGNFALPSTANPTAAATTVAVNVQLQLSVPSGRQFTLVEYGISFAAAPAGALITLRSTSTAATLGTACMTPTPYSNPNAPASSTTTTTATTAFASSSTAVPPAATVNMVYDAQVLSTNTYIKQFPLAREPMILASDFLQLVVTAGAISTAYCYYIWRE
jgi:hypothetical protein